MSHLTFIYKVFPKTRIKSLYCTILSSHVNQALYEAISFNTTQSDRDDKSEVYTMYDNIELMVINDRVRPEECTDQEALSMWRSQIKWREPGWKEVRDDPERYREHFEDDDQCDYYLWLRHGVANQ
ncbi:hypothetical protein I203_103122 [Kwoniella mangroviensis CBS 8507]|uniref:uncharacterized protein n=1 Tax=Kwoniella mangroviensis CBS 8507 TaxID=1296122 RepID=UPI00080CC63A|nr:uncharacterized protein I203_07505 [Kwoniella mangroviensis CBS 8507]OCF63437.1 hypothetical protein I203_07505 [Kwoniella mangroviensis CBS 8507]